MELDAFELLSPPVELDGSSITSPGASPIDDDDVGGSTIVMEDDDCGLMTISTVEEEDILIQ